MPGDSPGGGIHWIPSSHITEKPHGLCNWLFHEPNNSSTRHDLKIMWALWGWCVSNPEVIYFRLSPYIWVRTPNAHPRWLLSLTFGNTDSLLFVFMPSSSLFRPSSFYTYCSWEKHSIRLDGPKFLHISLDFKSLHNSWTWMRYQPHLFTFCHFPPRWNDTSAIMPEGWFPLNSCLFF